MFLSAKCFKIAFGFQERAIQKLHKYFLWFPFSTETIKIQSCNKRFFTLEETIFPWKERIHAGENVHTFCIQENL